MRDVRTAKFVKDLETQSVGGVCSGRKPGTTAR
jgi:hypothetical protein